jgi:flagellar hook protein FlgE
LSVIDNLFSQGTFENTESNTDLAIEGPGFFMVRDPNGSTVNYTRAGSFRFNQDGALVSPEGFRVQGYFLDADENTIGDLADIQVESRAFSPANATSKITLSTNLNANAPYLGVPFDLNDPAATSNYAASIRAYDSLGNTHLVTTYFNKMDPATNPLEWEFHTVVDGAELDGGTAGTLTEVGTGSLSFNSNGDLVSTTPDPITTNALVWANDSNPAQTITFDMQTTQFSSESVVISQQQDGFATGTLVKLEIDGEGNILGNYSNGQPRKLARLALAKFTNPTGLVKDGNNMFATSDSSGPPVIGTVGSGVGKIFTNSLEQSNVDLAQEFVKMITTQRGFQANSRIITTTDEMLNELINLKR